MDSGELPSNQLIDGARGIMNHVHSAASDGAARTSWIFQANPQVFRIRDALRDLRRLHWAARQFRDEMQPGDPVYVWESGPSGGLIATGKIVAAPQVTTPDAETSKYYTSPPAEESEPCVEVQFEQVFDRPLSRDDLLDEPLLKDMSLLRMPQATNFRLEPQEARFLAFATQPTPTFAEVLREYRAHGTVFQSVEKGALYAIEAVDETGCFVQRLSANEAERCTFSLYDARLQLVREHGGKLPFRTLDNTAAKRTTVLQGADFGLSTDREFILDVSDETRAIELFSSLITHLNVDTSSGRPRLYKPAMLACLIMAVDRGELIENRFEFDWLLPQFVQMMQSLGTPVDAQQAAFAFYHLSSELFWLLSYRDVRDVLSSGNVSPASIRQKVRHASLKAPFWQLLRRRRNRTALQDALQQRWWPHSMTKEQAGPSFWWVNQGQTFEQERAEGFIWAPQESQAGADLHHWSNVSKVRQGDVVFHYSRGEIRAISSARSDGHPKERPPSLPQDAWKQSGWAAELEYFDLPQTIPLPAIAPDLLKLDLHLGPINSVGKVNQGYLYRLSEDAARVIARHVSTGILPDRLRAAFERLGADPLEPLRQAFARFRENRVEQFRVQLRRVRAGQLRQLLADPEAIDLKTFNREAWVFESETRLDGEDTSGSLFEKDPTEDRLEALWRGLESGTLELHGNYMWGTATRVFGAPLRGSSDEQKLEHLRGGLRILNDANLPPSEKAEQIINTLGFGPNAASGLLMAYYPDQFAIWNKPSKDALRQLGYAVEPLTRFQESVKSLQAALGAGDLLELDWFLYQLSRQQITSAPAAEELKRDRSSRYWAVALGEGARLWGQCRQEGIIAIGWDYLGDMRELKTQEEFERAIIEERQDGKRPYNDALACYQFTHEMQIGDFVFAKKGLAEILGFGVVDSDYFYDPERSEYHSVRRVKWLAEGHWRLPDNARLPVKTLTDVSNYSRFLDFALPLVRAEEVEEQSERPVDTRTPYTIDDALKGLFLPKDEFKQMLGALARKKNIILQGPPGTGKTYIADRLAYALIGFRERSQIEMVQFHQSYAYEDFIQGWRPQASGGFTLRNGTFHSFCTKAAADGANDYVFIIDEINRGNLSKIFGELMMLLEADKRGPDFAIPLTYSGDSSERFYVPENVYVVGMMNTADRSLAMVDYALRRRFTFFDLRPRLDTPQFRHFLADQGVEPEVIEIIVERMGELNSVIRASTVNLGAGFEIGHSFFCPQGTEEELGFDWYASIIRSEIAPLLQEYWFDDPDKAEASTTALLA